MMELNIITNMNIIGLLIGILVTVSDHIGVFGQRSTRFKDGDIRLVGGRSANEGTVLIYHWSRWGSICDDYWDLRDANVVCNELGYVGARAAVTKSRFGKGRKRVWLSGLHCRGHERHVTMCYSRGWGNSLRRCRSYYASAGVVCNKKRSTSTTTTTTTTTKPRPTTTRQRTTPTTTTTTTTQRPPTTPTTTTTATTPVKTTTQKTTTKRPTTTTTTTTTQAPVPVVKTTTQKPTTTTPRVYNRWIFNRQLWRYFRYNRDGTHITSRPDPRYFLQMTNTTTRSTTTSTTTTPRPRRFNNRIGGENNNRRNNFVVDNISNNIVPNAPQQIRGRPENNVQRHEHRDRHGSSSVPSSVPRKDGYVGDQPLDDTVTITDPMEDNIVEELIDNQVGIPEIKVPAPTSPKPTVPEFSEFRLPGGRNMTGYKEGRLEVRLAGSNTWGTVCSDNWDFKAAIVVCKHFGVGYARKAEKKDVYGGGDSGKISANIRCTGKEQRLEDCTFDMWSSMPGSDACSNRHAVAGVICETRLPDLVPDILALERSAYLQDRYLYYLQCSYEENCLSSSATTLYGTAQWAYQTRRLFRFSTIASNIGTADFRPNLNVNDWEWHACHQHYHSMEAFSHYDIIDKEGNKVAEGHKASFCLEDTKCNRGVHPKYNCAQYGNQGISVGCSDSYLADIDCQWIDVSDLKSGMYTFKVEINPGMLVPESNFDNNVVRCKMYFNTRQARIWGCKLESLL